MADYAGCSVPKFDWATASISSWTRFETHVKQMAKGPLKGKGEDVVCAYLLIWLGDTGRDIFSTWILTEAETDKLDVYLKKFRDHIQPTVNPLVARYKFYKRSQNPGEGMGCHSSTQQASKQSPAPIYLKTATSRPFVLPMR